MIRLLSAFCATVLAGSALVAQTLPTLEGQTQKSSVSISQVEDLSFDLLQSDTHSVFSPSILTQQAADTYFGYANRASKDIGSLGLSKSGFIGGMTVLPEMPGNVVKGIKFYTNVGETCDAVVFVVGKDSKDPNAVWKVKTNKRFQAQQGWNVQAFDKPITAVENEVLAIGYQVMGNSGKNARPVSFDKASAFFAARDYVVFETAPLQEGGQLRRIMESKREVGNLLVFADIDDKQSKLSVLSGLNEVKIISETPEDGETFTPDKPIELSLNISNYGRTALTKIEGMVQDGESQSAQKEPFSLQVNIPAFTSTVVKVKTPLKTIKKGLGTIFISLNKINGVDTKTTILSGMQSKIISYKVQASGGAVPRSSLLVERFTGERCGNCPQADAALEAMLEEFEKNPTFAEIKINVISHHSGFYTDFLTQPESEQLIRYCFVGGSYAPAVMFNRAMGGEALALSFLQQDRAKFEEALRKALSPEQPVELRSVKAKIEGNKITLRVEGWAGNVMRDQLRISAVLTESNIKPRAQQGVAAYTRGTFLHQNAPRQFLTPYNGMPVTYKKDTGNFTFDLGEVVLKNKDWKMEDLKLVVFAHQDINWPKMSEREVFASITLDYNTLTATSEILPEDVPAVSVQNGFLTVIGAAQAVEVYDMAGRLISTTIAKQLVRGVYVVKVNTAHGSFVHKVVVD